MDTFGELIAAIEAGQVDVVIAPLPGLAITFCASLYAFVYKPFDEPH